MTPEDLISRGFYIFPCQGKKPLVKWGKESSNDLSTIRNWKARFPNCNWAINCGLSDIGVVDVDCGKIPSADDTLCDLQLTHGVLPPTFKVRTQSGGYHLYLHGALKNSASNKLGTGLDTRGVGGYVVAPGSPGYTVELDLPIADIPDWVSTLVGQPNEPKTPAAPDIALDTPYAISQSILYLQTAPPAIEGEGGDSTTYRIACRLRDFGLSPSTCLTLMLEHWDPRCLPPWGEALSDKVTNAYNYAENSPGISDPTTVFTEYVEPVSTSTKSRFIDARELLSREITIDYLISDLIETPSTGLMFGESTAGKSFLALDLALGVATGTGWLSHLAKQGTVFYLAGEGQKGIPRRMKAWTNHHNLLPEERALYVSRSRIEINAAAAAELRKEISDMSLAYGPPALIVIDTLARHLPPDADENSAKDIGAFINAVDSFKDAFHCVVLIIHHSGKKAMESSRGSSALKAAMDFEILVRPGIVKYTKQKDGELPGAFGFALVDVPVENGKKSAVVVASAIDPTVKVDLKPQAVIALQCLRMEVSQCGGRGVNREVWRQAFYGKLGDVTKDAKTKAFTRAEEELLKAKMVEIKNGEICLSEAESED